MQRNKEKLFILKLQGGLSRTPKSNPEKPSSGKVPEQILKEDTWKSLMLKYFKFNEENKNHAFKTKRKNIY